MSSWLSPAKTNLYLAIGPQQANGYHTLATCFAPLQLHDTLRMVVKNSTEPGDSSVELHCPSKPLTENPEDNLIVRAARAFCAACNPTPSVQIHIDLEKVIPTQAGMGGGSSNAATTLLALNQHPLLPTLEADTLTQIAKTLGADVPFFLNPQLAWGNHRGDELAPITMTHPWPNWPILVVQPTQCPMPTVTAFKVWAEYRSKETPETINAFVERTQRQCQRIEALFHQAAPPTRANLEALLHNDFETVLFSQYPTLKEIIRRMTELGIDRPWLSGSGSAMMGLLPVTFCNALMEPGARQHVMDHEIAPMFEALGCNVWLTQLGIPRQQRDCQNIEAIVK